MTGRQHLAGLDAEIHEHLERETQDLVDGGLPIEAARAEARRRFGNITLIKENTRAVWYPLWLEQAWQDFRGSLRMMRRTPGFSLVVVLTLALAIGLNVAVFSVVNAALIRPLSFPHPDRMVWLGTGDARDSDEFATSVDFLGWRDASSLAGIVAYDEFDGRVSDGAGKATARVASVSEDFWTVAGARAELGRVPSTSEPAMMISRAYFERRFGGDPSVIGRTLIIDERRAPVVGVLPKNFHPDLVAATFAEHVLPKAVDVYQLRPVQQLPQGMVQIFRVFAELKPGVSIDSARSELAAIRARVMNSLPMARSTLRVVSLKDRLVERARPTLLILSMSVAFVLLVGCANIAALLLARGTARRRELAIRIAIGAGRGRVVRQLLVETLVLAAGGGILGLLLAHLLLGLAIGLLPDAVPRLADARLDQPVLLFSLALTLLTAVIFGLGPALSLQSARAYDRLKDGVRTTSETLARVRARAWLVVGEIAITLVLLCGAGLLVKSLWRLTTYPAGFSPEHILTLTVQYDGDGQDRTGVRRRQFVAEVLERLETLPGLEAAGMSTNRSGRMTLLIENAPPVPDSQRVSALHSGVSGDYARAIGMHVVSGRWLTDNESQPVFVVNETVARRAFPGQDPIGHRLQVDGPRGASEANGGKYASIVGVVADLKYDTLDRASEPEIFGDYKHTVPYVMNFVVRIDGEPSAATAAFRGLVAGVDPTQPLSDVKTVEAVLSDSIAPRRFTVLLLSTFAGFALLLALIGVYGVIAYSVSLRTGEIGVRMALGAERRTVLWMVMRQGLTIAAAGVLSGLALAFAATRVMSSLLYEVTPTDAATFGFVAVAMIVTIALACFAPAVRAASVDPLKALKYE